MRADGPSLVAPVSQRRIHQDKWDIYKMKGLLLLAIAALAHGFTPAPSPRQANTKRMASPLDNILGFIKGGKIGLVKSIAGEYDADAIRLRVDQDIAKNKVLMYSFTT